MNWKVRHEGSPEWVERTLPELETGLADGVWETTDEVQEPGSGGWVSFDAHPHFADVCEELEAPPKPAHEGETHLDMNALIDVTMVLLIFFILTTSMGALQKRIEAPSVEKGKVKAPVMSDKEVQETTVHVKAKVAGGETQVMVEGKPAQLDGLVAEIKRYTSANSKKTSLLLEFDDDVKQDVVVQIIDKAKLAGLDKVKVVIP